MQNTLRGRFIGPELFEGGEPIRLTFELWNDGDEEVVALVRDTPLDGPLHGRCLEVRKEGERIPYDGIHAKRSQPREGEYVAIPAGEAVSGQVLLHDSYEIAGPGHFSVAYAGQIQDCVPASSVVHLKERGEAVLHSGETYLIGSEPFTFQVRGEGPNLQTLGMKARSVQARAVARPSLKAGDPKAPAFVGGTGIQKAEVARAHETAYVMCDESVSELGASSPALYVTWFGKDDDARRKTVTTNYMDIRSTMQSEQLTYDLTGIGCQSGWYAYTYHGARTVHLCEAFWPAPATGPDSQAGTLVHEWSHAVACTEDIAYGRTGCQALARSKPDEAINNADNYEYFAEDV